MRTKARYFAIIAASLTIACGAFAEGAGGPIFALAQPSRNPSFMPPVSSSAPDLEFMGAYGYGVTRDDFIVGGFGLAFLDYEIYDNANWNGATMSPAHAAGGAGGMVVGSRIFGSRYAHLDVAARLGLGGMYYATKVPWVELGPGQYRYDEKGYAIVYAEPYVELGVGPLPWLHLSAYLSYPYIGNFIPGKPFSDISYYSPVLGVAVSFGWFEK